MYRHYITIDDQNRVINGWSTGEKSGLGPGGEDILITDRGGYHFSLIGVDNPKLRTSDGILLFKWNGTKVELRTQEEISADRPKSEGIQEPTELEKLRADIDYIMIMEGLI